MQVHIRGPTTSVPAHRDPAAMRPADAVVTGEGRLDSNSLAGKVVGGILDLAAGWLPVGCVVGDVASAVDTAPWTETQLPWVPTSTRGGEQRGDGHRVPALIVASLVARAGADQAHSATLEAIEDAVEAVLPWPDRLADRVKHGRPLTSSP